MATYKDRISELPEPILHDIMGMVPIKYAVRMSTLSKRWYRIWQTLPFLDFDREFYLPHCYTRKAKRYRKNAHLMRKARQMVLSGCQGKEFANLLKLVWVFPTKENFPDFKLELGMLMHNVSKTQVRQLCLVNYNSDYTEDFLSLPSPLILPRLINHLHLSGFVGLKNLLPASSSGLGDAVKFQYLSIMSLHKVDLEDEVVNGFNVTCPFLVILNLENCFGLKYLHLTGLLKLKILVLKYLATFETLETVKIEVLPRLSQLIIEEKTRYPYRVVDLDNKLFGSLILLQFVGDFLTDDLFNEFVCKCRYLRFLILGNSKELKKVRISMYRLQDLRIFCVDNLEKVEIKAPLLRHFLIKTFVYNKPPAISWEPSKSVQKVFVIVDAYGRDWNIFTPNDDMLETWREFFGYFNNARKLQLLAPTVFLNWLERERSLSPLCCVKDLSFLSSDHESPPVLHLLQSLIFLAPRATTLSITNMTTPDHKTRTIFADIVIKFLDDAHNKDAGDTSSSSSSSSCNQSQFLGIESWLQSVSEVTVQEFNGEECELNELNNFFGQVKNFTPIHLPSPCIDIDLPFYISE